VPGAAEPFPVTIDSDSQVLLPLTGKNLWISDGKTKISVTFLDASGKPNPALGHVNAKVATNPPPSPEAVIVTISLPPDLAAVGTLALVTVTTSVGSATSKNYKFETVEQTARRSITNPVEADVVVDAIHAAETPEQTIDRIAGSLPDKEKRLLADAFARL
jgi:hypothetical protein